MYLKRRKIFLLYACDRRVLVFTFVFGRGGQNKQKKTENKTDSCTVHTNTRGTTRSIRCMYSNFILFSDDDKTAIIIWLMGRLNG